MLENLITGLVSLHLAVFGVFIGVKLFNLRFFGLNAYWRLRLSYLLLILAVLMPFVGQKAPMGNPFGVIAKYEVSQAPAVVAEADSHELGFRLLETPVTPEFQWRASKSWIFPFVGVLILGMLQQFFRMLWGFWSLSNQLSGSFLWKRVGRVRIWLNEECKTPYSFWMGGAHVILPVGCLEKPRNLRIALKHELQHHRQRDGLWAYLVEFLRVPLVGNPILPYTFNLITEIQELACDEALIDRKNIRPAQYGKCLLDFAEQQGASGLNSACVVGMAMRSHQLKRRIEEMFRIKRNKKQNVWRALVVGLLAVPLVAGPALALPSGVAKEAVSFQKAQSLAEKMNKDRQIPIVVTDEVLHWLNSIVTSSKKRAQLRLGLKRLEALKPMLTEKLGAADVPIELVAVPLIESNYRNDAKSYSKALGIWQFIASTARRSGLKVNDEIDERLDPVASTEAATVYYNRLYDIFRDWHLSILAYNVGENRLSKAILKEGHSEAFRIAASGAVGKEGGSYLPKVMAAMIIVANPELVD